MYLTPKGRLCYNLYALYSRLCPCGEVYLNRSVLQHRAVFLCLKWGLILI
nr:MAG TPA: hypothetical protein [Caudoviricetes sp.]